jgi:hypothetical protein
LNFVKNFALREYNKTTTNLKGINMGCHIRLKHKPFKVKTPLSKREQAWRILRICKSGTNTKLTVGHPKVVEAAEMVGIGRAIRFLTRPASSRDLMVMGRRQPGSFASKQ